MLYFLMMILCIIYISKVSFDFIYELPKIVYSFLISFVVNNILGIFALSSGDIIEFKQNISKYNLTKGGNILMKKLKNKFCFYFILSIILLLCFLYYLSMFFAIYINTQLYLLKDTLISFGLGFIYPFVTYLIPELFRIRALSNPAKQGIYLYRINKLFPYF